MDVVSPTSVNRILLVEGGSDAVAAYATLQTIGNTSNCISTGIGGVSLTLSGILYNDEDVTGLKVLLKSLSRYAVILGAGMMLLLLLFAPAFVGVFISQGGAVRTFTIQGVRLFALGLIPCCINNALKSFYQGTDRVWLTEIISVLEGALLPALAAFILSRFWGVSGVWLNFIAGETMTLLFIAMFVWRRSHRCALNVQPFMMLREDFDVKPGNLMEINIHSLNDVEEASKQAENFCLQHGQNPQMANHIALCVEEMASNTVIHGFSKEGKNNLSIRIQNKGRHWILRFRDDCRAFDPVSYVPKDEDDAIGIQLVMAMADDFRYTYSMNMNNLTIKLID